MVAVAASAVSATRCSETRPFTAMQHTSSMKPSYRCCLAYAIASGILTLMLPSLSNIFLDTGLEEGGGGGGGGGGGLFALPWGGGGVTPGDL
eukprot:COSAG01_NODE_45371_length_409_cov_215.738710_1_plen_92_part_00